jgi:2-succinyl-5-enolpyruvyl-6-hydroxy-3-cyclohexene-1-carboxylate synthase
MDQAKVNERFAVTFADQLAASGVTDVCLAPGSRSAPLAMAFARHPGLRTRVLIDERCCSFFAVGLAKASGRPVAILCTSGTAAAELHAAVVEAHHSHTPLLVLTADRPPELIGVGANQAIDQAHLYGSAVRWYHNPGVPDEGPAAGTSWRRLAARAVAEATEPPAGAVHLNLPFREPLVPPPGPPEPPLAGRLPAVHIDAGRRSADLSPLREALARAERPVLIAGEMRHMARLGRAAAAAAMPVLAEPSSHLRQVELPYDAMLRDPAWAGSHQPDLVVRIGAPPTSKPLNQWLAAAGARTFLVAEDGWPDPDLLATDLLRCDPLPVVEALAGPATAWTQAWRLAAERASRALDAVLAAGPLHEGHAVRALAAAAPPDAALFVGSSMPIRDVDTFWPRSGPAQSFLGNRGASGIDGLVSSGLGMAAAWPDRPAVLLLGDLSLYHDMNGLWAVRRHGLRATFVVLDNDGGGIFEFLPQAAHQDVFEELFATPLGLRLEDVARLYGLRFASADRVEELPSAMKAALAADEPVLLSVRFKRSDSVAGHRACWRAVAEALAV